jgi:TolA-binding protein
MDPNTMYVHLDDGFVCADIKPDPEHRVHFRVITPMGNVDIKGTAFAVTASDDGGRVEVVRGEVAVAPKGAAGDFSVRAGSVFDMKTRHIGKLEDASEERIRAFLGMQPMKTEIPQADVSMMTTTDIPSEEPLSANTKDTAAPLSPASHLSRPSLKKLLDEAAECRIDKDWRCAAKAYDQVIMRFPHRPEAATALVTLGQIQLGHLRKPREARRNFERYQRLRPSGPLSEQALHGIALSDQALGDIPGEKQALELFVTRHPSSPLAGSARQRLSELKKK